MRRRLSLAKRFFAISAFALILAFVLAAPILLLVAQERVNAREIAQRYNSYNPPFLGNWVFGNDLFGWSLTVSVGLTVIAFGFLGAAFRCWYHEFSARDADRTRRRSFPRLPSPRRFGIASLLILVACFAVGFSAHRYFSAPARYQRNGDVETLRYLLSTQIDQGDTLGRVTSILGPGRRDDGKYLQRMLNWKAGPRFDPNVLGPDGIEEGDLFIFYSANPKPSYGLQLRDGILVNHDPKWYVGPDDTALGLH